MKIRDMTEKDLREVSKIESESFSDAWSEDAFKESLLNENCHMYVAASDADDEIFGYVSVYFADDEGEIENVCVKESVRNRGIGFSMMSKMILKENAYGITKFFLEVRKSNEAAKALYKKLGFAEIGIRKGFYENPREDASVMKLLTNSGVQ